MVLFVTLWGSALQGYSVFFIHIARKARENRRYKNIKNLKKQTLRPSSYALLSDFAELDRVFTELDEEEAERREEELTARLDALALKDPKEATAVFLQSPFFMEDLEENELYLSSNYRITKEQLATELNTPEKRATYIADLDRQFDEAYAAGKHIIIGSGGFIVLDDTEAEGSESQTPNALPIVSGEDVTKIPLRS